MSKNLTQLRKDTRLLLDEQTAADWSVAQVDSSINYAYHEIVTSVIEAFEDYYSKTDTLSTVDGQQEYDVETDGLPTDFFKMRRVEINYDVSNSNSSPSRATAIGLDDVKKDLGNTSIGTLRAPSYYLIGRASNLKLGFIPVPNEDGTDAIKIWYVYLVSDLSETTDTPDIPYEDRYSRLIGYGAAADLLRKGQQEEVAAARYRAEFELGLEKMKQQLEDRRADGVKTITDTIGMDTDFSRQYAI